MRGGLIVGALLMLTLSACTPGSPPDVAAETPTPTEASSVPVPAMDLPESYASADFSLVAVAERRTFASHRHATNRVVVATLRWQSYNGCGSVYAEPCYFFAESFARSEEQVSRFVARWPDKGDATDGLVSGSLRFLSGERIAFRTAGGDGCCTFDRSWVMDLKTGAARMTSCKVEGAADLERAVCGPLGRSTK